MKRQKRVLTLGMMVCAIMTAVSFPTLTLADSSTIMEKLDSANESTETEDDHAEDTSYSLLRGSDLNYGTTGILKLSEGQVNVDGITQCNHVCDKVYVSIFLERKVSGSYATYKYWEFSTTNATHINKSIDVIVPSGYYYRVRGYHATYNDGRKEATSTLTDAIWVN